jgi:hypothetical protein
MKSQYSQPGLEAAVDFGQTRWSVVAALGEGHEAERSLRELCRRYWVPVYAYVRRCGHPSESAAELVQSFLSHLVTRLRGDGISAAGGFRDFLVRELEKFLASDWTCLESTSPLPDLAPPWPLEEIEQRQRLADQPLSPALAFQRAFAMELLAHAMHKLEEEVRRSGRSELFLVVRPFLSREPGPGECQRIAVHLNSSPLAMAIAIKRLRQRFQELIDIELMQTVGDADALAAERLTLLSTTRYRS